MSSIILKLFKYFTILVNGVCLSLPKADEFLKNQLQLLAYNAASAYCNNYNITTNLTLASLSNSTSFNISEKDIISANELQATVSDGLTMVLAFIYTNSILDHYPVANNTGKCIIVSFRGTSNFENRVLDYIFLQTKGRLKSSPEDSEIHSGFWIAWESIQTEVFDAISTQILSSFHSNFTGANIFIVGHSLGGAIASLCAVQLYQIGLSGMFPGISNATVVPESNGLNFNINGTEFMVTISLYTYGMPRVGNKIYADWVSSMSSMKIYRVTNLKDVVPHLPPMIVGYKHHISEYYISTEGILICNVGNIDENPECSESVPFSQTNLQDHQSYLNVHFGVRIKEILD